MSKHVRYAQMMAGAAALLVCASLSPAAASELGTPSAETVPAKAAFFSKQASGAVVDARLISTPDMFNADIGDISHVPGFKKGYNTWNATKAANMANLFGQLGAENANAYLAAGDIVQGRWTEDQSGTGIFGPVGTAAQAKRRIRVAGNAYYSAWKGFWTGAGVPMSKVLPVVGDHEIGDNPWSTKSVKAHNKFVNVQTFKDVWAKHFTRDAGGRLRHVERPQGSRFGATAYAVYVTPKLLVVSVDVFKQTKDSVRVIVDGAQLAWLERVLAEGNSRGATIVVQGHTPVAGPVRTCSCSSGLYVEGGVRSEFWKTMVKHGVDFYFAGEVHASSARQEAGRGPVQITHGTIAGYGAVGFLRMDVMTDGTVAISNREIPVAVRGSGKMMWQTRGSISADFTLAPTSVETGAMIVSAGGTVVQESGDLVRLR